MSGYTPVFRSVFQGSLCGKYPDLPVWLVLLALADKHGEIDAHPSYIAMVSGIPQADVEVAISRFCEPDATSRTHDDDGRRLAPLPNRGFGWTIINHGKYREKARLAAKSEREVETGRNAERMEHRRRPPETAGDRRSPPVTDPSYADSDSYADSESSSEISLSVEAEVGAHAPSPPPKKKLARRIPDDWQPSVAGIEYAEKELPNVDVPKLAEAFTDYWRAAAGEKARKLDWDAAWRTWVRRAVRDYPTKRHGSQPERVIRRDINGREIHG